MVTITVRELLKQLLQFEDLEMSKGVYVEVGTGPDACIEGIKCVGIDLQGDVIIRTEG